jgi:hypothetical protein
VGSVPGNVPGSLILACQSEPACVTRFPIL